MKRICLILLSFLVLTGFLEYDWQKLASEANEYALAGDDSTAIRLYKKAILMNPGNPRLKYNLGTLLVKTGKEAIQYLISAETPDDKEVTSRSLYNIGNSLFESKNYADAAKSYIQSLKLDPNDNKTKENLELALKMLKESPPPPPKQEEKKDDKKDDKQPGDGQKQDKQDKRDGKEENMQQKQVERMLDSLKEDEEKVQREVHEKRIKHGASVSTDKDW